MRLTVHDVKCDFDRQTHAYAEYRAFATLAGRADPIEDVTVTLARRGLEAEEEAQVSCAIAVRLRSGEVVGVEASAGRPYAAIERAVRLVSAHHFVQRGAS
jgi:hypothetical protein